jgi:rubrerythrin
MENPIINTLRNEENPPAKWLDALADECKNKEIPVPRKFPYFGKSCPVCHGSMKHGIRSFIDFVWTHDWWTCSKCGYYYVQKESPNKKVEWA